MTLPGQSAFLKALGWALLNSLWQFGLLWLVFILLINARKNFSPAARHGLALLFISAGFTWFGASLCLQYFAYSEPAGPGINYFLINSNSFFSSSYISARNFLDSNLSYLSCVYLLVVAILFIRFSRFFYRSHIIQTQGLSKLRAELRLLVQQLAEQLDIRRKVQVWVSKYIDTPMIIGFLKPTILIPIASINQLSVKQLEAILLHELAHIKRNDYLVNLYVATTEILFFFNPFTRLFVRCIKQERENSCDDWVLQFRFDPYQYASALLALERSRATSFSFGISASGGNRKTLLNRIQRIMNVKQAGSYNRLHFFAHVLSVSLLGFVAFVNPGDVVMKKLGNNLPYLNKYLVSASKENKHYLVSPEPVLLSGKNEKNSTSKPARENARQDLNSKIKSNDDHSFAIEASTDPNTWVQNTNQLVEAVNSEEIDFSIPENKQPDVPVEAAAPELPFVPSSSFSYNRVDTVHPRIRVQAHVNRSARESLVKAQKALEKLDWKKLEVQVKINNKIDIVRLKKEIQQSLEQLNWQQIDEEARKCMEKENIENMKASLQAEYNEVKKYKEAQQQFERIQNELQKQKDNYQKETQIKFNQIQKELSKKRIIVYL